MTIKEWWGARPHGGVHAPHRKNTAECETIVMPPPERILLAMSQHLGAPCVPTVKAGDRVAVGQVVGDSDKPLSAPVHSGVSGTVTGMTELLLPGGRTTQAVVIEADGEQRMAMISRRRRWRTVRSSLRRSGHPGWWGSAVRASRPISSSTRKISTRWTP